LLRYYALKIIVVDDARLFDVVMREQRFSVLLSMFSAVFSVDRFKSDRGGIIW